tara:strand:+ start:59 stop:631 length:573 start_codon:yes stop_codon:yes gene_type:complete
MAFIDHILRFEDDGRIIDLSDTSSVCIKESESVVIMKEHTDFICEGKGDILEIGFGMGISANYIQAQDVNSHTIVDIHPQVIEKLKIWAEDKDNVTIVEGDWYSVEGLSTYDGIFIDTYKDDNWNEFKNFTSDKIKSGGRITYWNMNPNGANNEFGYNTFSYKEIDIDVVDDDSYLKFNNNKYCIPMVEL